MSEIKKRNLNPLALVLGLSAVLFGLFLIFSFVYFFSKGGDRWKDSGDNSKIFASAKGEYVGIIELKGVIMDSKKILKNLKDAEEDKEIKAVVLRLDSPGGAVAPSQEIYEAVKKFPKPLVVSMASVAASGAYYVASGAKKIYANAGTLTGSIGVIMEFLNLKKLYDWAKIERFSIKTGKFKDSGADYREMNSEEKAYFQTLVFNTLDQFKSAVAEGRHLPLDQVSAIADGRVFTGIQAKQLKLVDEIGTLDDAVQAVAKEAKIEGKPKVAYPAKKSRGFLDLFTNREEDDDGFEEGRSFIDRIVDHAVDRVIGQVTGLRASSDVRPAGLYWIWNGTR